MNTFNLMSDLHLEFFDLELPGGNNLILAGDIVPAVLLKNSKNLNHLEGRIKYFFKKELSKYNQVYYILGNHEYYNGFWNTVPLIIKEFCHKTNIKFLNVPQNPFVELKDLIIWGDTMWTEFGRNSPILKSIALNSMADYRVIHENEDSKIKLKPDSVYEHFKKSIQSLKDTLIKFPDKDFLVITHHAPTFKSVHETYKGDDLNFAFANELDLFILDHPQIKVWVHGHTHNNFSYKIGETQVYCNPRGYVSRFLNENPKFDINFNFTI